MTDVMVQYGITASEAAVASMVGQAFRLISPVIPALYMLVASTETNFVKFQLKYVKYAWPIILRLFNIYLSVQPPSQWMWLYSLFNECPD